VVGDRPASEPLGMQVQQGRRVRSAAAGAPARTSRAAASASPRRGSCTRRGTSARQRLDPLQRPPLELVVPAVRERGPASTPVPAAPIAWGSAVPSRPAPSSAGRPPRPPPIPAAHVAPTATSPEAFFPGSLMVPPYGRVPGAAW
jgi:hypothetical protein